MPLQELKEKLHDIINSTNNEILLEDMLLEAQSRTTSKSAHKIEGLSKKDYEELKMLAKEEPMKNTISYNELKSSLSRWFTS
jgi:hypothetical protein